MPLAMNDRSLAAAFALALLGAACTAEPVEGPDCADGKCDTAAPCAGRVVDLSGRESSNILAELNDPLADLVLKDGNTCPTTFDGIMDKLRRADKGGFFDNAECVNGSAGIVSRVVSETAQLVGEPTDYRVITTKECRDRERHEIIFSLFGLQADQARLPDTVEVIAFDEARGVFNYYKTAGDRIEFFGNSKEMLQGPDGELRECATCHVGGGLIMKEFEAPWLHWESGGASTPGAAALVDTHENLGEKASGADMERLVRSGNFAWNFARVEHLRQNGTVEELLEPLFCSVEVNLDTGADDPSPPEGGAGGDELERVPNTAVLVEDLRDSGILASVDPAEYDALIKAAGQEVPGFPETVDTILDFPFIMPSQIDMNYQGALKGKNIIDHDFVLDVLMVDFTRAVFSDDRCGLLGFAPELPPDQRGPDAIRQGFIDNIRAADPAPGSPAAEFLSWLEIPERPEQEALVDEFVDACRAQEDTSVEVAGVQVSAFLSALYQYTTVTRRKAQALPVFEFPQTLPDSDLEAPEGARLHPRTCQLTDQFVAVAPESAL